MLLKSNSEPAHRDISCLFCSRFRLDLGLFVTLWFYNYIEQKLRRRLVTGFILTETLYFFRLDHPTTVMKMFYLISAQMALFFTGASLKILTSI